MASPKSRDYFITINKNADCYLEALDILKDLNFKLYAYIIHDKDFIINEENEQAHLKETHKHIVVELKNPVSFESMLNKFKGAHIETIKYKKTAYQYLLHESPNAKEKYHYDITELVSNQIEAVKAIIEAEEGLELFKEAEFLQYIIDGITTPYRFVRRFGLMAYKQYWLAYNQMLIESQTDSDMQRDLDMLRQERNINQAKQELFGDSLEVED